MIRGEIWLLNLDPTIGAEMKKVRPVVIVSSDAIGELPLKVVVPITDWKSHYAKAAWKVRLEPNPNNGLSKSSAADTFQIRSVAHERFIRKLGELSNIEIKALAKY